MKTTKKKTKTSNRKFHLALFFAVVGSLALMVGKMDGGSYVALATLILGAYGAANVAEHHINMNAGGGE